MFSVRLQFAVFAAPQDRAYHLHRTFPPSAGSEVSARRLCAPPQTSYAHRICARAATEPFVWLITLGV